VRPLTRTLAIAGATAVAIFVARPPHAERAPAVTGRLVKTTAARHERPAPAPGASAVDVARLVADAAGEDPVKRIDAIDALVNRGHVASLPSLLAFDPASDPFVAPTVIVAIGQLARLASPAEQRRAIERLSALLVAEKERRGQDSAGNVVLLVEALGALGAPDAAPVLER